MLSEIFNPTRIKLNLESTTRTGVFEELVETIAGSDPEYNYGQMLEAVTLRETKMNTVIMPGIAIPHGYYSAINGIVGAIGFSPAGIEYDVSGRESLPDAAVFTETSVSSQAPHESGLRNPVHLFFMLLMDDSSREKHLHVLSRLLYMINSTAFTGIRGTESPQELYKILSSF